MKPFRFGVNVRHAQSRAEWAHKARKIEDLGYSDALFPAVVEDAAFLHPAHPEISVIVEHRVGIRRLWRGFFE